MDALIQLAFCLLLSVSTSLTAVVFVNILTQPGMIFDWWAIWLRKQQDKYVGTTVEDYYAGDDGPELADYYAGRHERSEYVLKPLLTCVYCVSGQLSFWACLYLSWWYFNAFNVNLSLLCAGVGIFLAGLFEFVQQRYFPQ